MKPLTLEWIDKAEGDYRALSALGSQLDPVWDIICYHAQQTAEKYLKAWLHEQGVEFPRTHDLEVLTKLCLTSLQEIAVLLDDLRMLSIFGTEIRYPGIIASKEDADACLRAGGAARKMIRTKLGLAMSS
jgi:HEPN domain-containing protein